jgi:hypothetical protein
MQMSTRETEIVESEQERIVSWREQELSRAGYGLAAARALARAAEIDLHQAVDLVKAGCDPQLAVRILL